MLKIVVLAIAAFCVSDIEATPGAKCNDNSPCDAGECCFQINRMIVSKRILPIKPVYQCQRYKTEGEECGGGCGCASGLICERDQFVIGRAAPAKSFMPLLPGVCKKPAK